MSKFKLRLFITGRTPKSERTISNLNDICNNELKGSYELEIIDVLENPDLAEEKKILVTPTLIKDLPPPLKRVIGDLTDTEKVLIGLDLKKAVEK